MDWIAIVLIILLILIPYAPFLKRISFGALEAELQPRIREIEKEVREIPAEEKERVGMRGAERISEEFYSLLEEDHRLALAKLRMELERILRKILISKGKEAERLSIGRMVSILQSEEDTEKGALHAIRDVVGLCNQAVHGEEIRKQAEVHCGADINPIQDDVVLVASYYDMNDLLDVEPKPGSIFILSQSEFHDESGEIQHEKLLNWCDHYGMPQYQAHASGHAMPHELKSVIREIDPETVIPIHTERPSLYESYIFDLDIDSVSPELSEKVTDL